MPAAQTKTLPRSQCLLLKSLAAALLTAFLGCGVNSNATADNEFPVALNRTTVFMGDSITQRWPLPIHNEGIGGQVTSQMLARFQSSVLGRGYARVVILGGTNDILENKTLSQLTGNLASMAAIARAAGIEVVLCTIPPLSPNGKDLNSEVMPVNTAITQLATRNGYLLVDYYTPMSGHADYFIADGIHPSPMGYSVMEAALAAVVAN